MNQIVSALIIGIAVFLALSTGHFFPWHALNSLQRFHVLRNLKLTDDYGRLKRVPSYIYGVSSIGIGLTVWMEINHFDQLPLLGFWFFAICAGAGTAGGYAVDALINRNADRREKHDGTPHD